MRRVTPLFVLTALAAAAVPALAQCGCCAGAAAGGPAMSLKLAAVGGDSLDIGKLVGSRPLVLLVAGTDATSKAAALAVEQAFDSSPGHPAGFYGIIKAGPAAAKTAARSWNLGYTVLADPDSRALGWLKAGKLPFVAFIDATGSVAGIESDITTASVLEGMVTMAKTGEKLVDPVCGMTVTREGAASSADHAGKTYYFCSAACKSNFVKDPAKYLDR